MTAGWPAGGPVGGNPTHRPMRRRTVTVGLIVAGFVLCALALAVVFDLSMGVTATLLAAAVAVLPLLVVVPTFLWLDRYEAEPARILLFAFCWGALCAPLGALLLNTASQVVFILMKSQDPTSLAAIVSAPPVEEGLKGLGVLLVVWRRRSEFDGVVDGIVYAGLVASGFAFTENILYLGQAINEAGVQGLTALFIMRCVMAPFAHPIFTSMTGIGLGIAVTSVRSRLGKVAVVFLGYACAVLLHLLWNLSTVLEAYLRVYVLVEVPVFLAYLALLVTVRRHEHRVIERSLALYAHAGWVSPAEVRMMSDLTARAQARRWAAGVAGPRGAQAVRTMQDSGADLALLRDRMTRGTAGPDAQRREQVLLGAIAQARAFLGVPPPGSQPGSQPKQGMWAPVARAGSLRG